MPEEAAAGALVFGAELPDEPDPDDPDPDDPDPDDPDPDPDPDDPDPDDPDPDDPDPVEPGDPEPDDPDEEEDPDDEEPSDDVDEAAPALAADVSADPAEEAAFLPESRLSFLEKPEPLKTTPTALKTLRSAPPQAGQVVSAGSVKLWTASSRSSHAVQAYW